MIYRGIHVDRGFETWIDRDDDQIVWEPRTCARRRPGSTEKAVEGTGKYTSRRVP
jgi:hypothetical protein